MVQSGTLENKPVLRPCLLHGATVNYNNAKNNQLYS